MEANIENFRELLRKANGNKLEMQKVLNRISNYLASTIIGREFGETVEHYFDRKPRIKAIHDWTQKVTISKDYTIVSI